MSTIERILTLIENNFASVAEFERKYGIKPKTVATWKMGTSSAYLKQIPQLAEFFGVSSSYLLCETDDPSPPLVQEGETLYFRSERDFSDLDHDEQQQVIDFIQFLRDRKK